MKYVFDSSSLSHAFEDLTHAIASAVMFCKGKEKCDIKRFLRRRFLSEYDTKELLLNCDVDMCYIPTDIEQELTRNPIMRDELEIFVKGDELNVRGRYGSKASGISKYFHSRLRVLRPSIKYYYDVLDTAKRLGITVSKQDMKAIALAYQEHATLVTADRKMKEIAEAMGVPVIYTVGLTPSEEKKVKYSFV